MIWVVSDTHLTKSQILPEAFISKVGRGDIILHLGDLISLDIVEYLSGLCRVEAIHGNCDLSDTKRVLPGKTIVEIEGYKIGLIHGAGGPKDSLQLARNEFQGKVDIALFGHTHLPHHSVENGTLYFNPGSLRSGRNGINSFGLLHLDPKPWGELLEA